MNLKKILFGLLILALGLTAYGFVNQAKSSEQENSVEDKKAPDPNYFYVNARHKKSTNPSSLKNANSIADIIKYYPSSWITAYDSVVVYTTSNGKQYSAKGADASLTARQKELLSSADMFTDVVIYVEHKTTNSVTKELENGNVSYKIYVRPEIEAKFPDGMDGLQAYLKEKSEEEVAKLDSKMGFLAIAYFTINEEGKPESIEISEVEEYKGVEKVLTKVLNEMPQWTPAKDEKGNAVKQKFECVFGFGNKDGGC